MSGKPLGICDMTLSPIAVATLQATGLSTASNMCAQFLDHYQQQRPFSLDPLQLLRFLLLTLLTTPPNYHWQQFLERRFPAHIPTRRPYEAIELQQIVEEGGERQAQPPEAFSYRNTLTKWFIDCITVGAVLNTVAFLVIMGVLKARSPGSIWQSVVDDTIPIIVAGYRIWPLASIVSFSVIPVSKRIVFLSFIGFLWGIYMSLVAARV
ncbi:Mpv17/PMP22 [Metarhizium brunneum]